MSTIPSLALLPSGYKASKVYSVLPTDGSGDLTFTRAADTATRVNSDGLIESVLANIPRLDYLNSSCPRLLLEPQRTNLALYSEQFDNAYWTKTNATITANNAVSPDGFTNADKLVEDSTSNAHLIRRDITTTAASYTFTVYAKAAERSYIFLYNTTATYGKVFNLSTGTVGTGTVGTVTASIQSAGNGWYRCSITGTATAASNAFRIYVLSTDTTSAAYTGDGTSGILIYGAQIELGAYGTSYIPTLGAAVTRGEDLTSKAGISSLIGQTEGTIFVDIDLPNNAANDIFTFASTGVNDIFLASNGGNLLTRIYYNSNALFFAQYAIPAAGGRFKMAIAYKSVDSAFYVNGTLVGTNTGSFAFTATLGTINLTNNQYAGRNNKNINQALLFKTRLTNAELAELTTI
jgi:hypothetical protein